MRLRTEFEQRGTPVVVDLEGIPKRMASTDDMIREAIITIGQQAVYRGCFARSMRDREVPWWDDNQLVFIRNCSTKEIIDAISWILSCGRENEAFEAIGSSEKGHVARPEVNSEDPPRISEQTEIAILNRLQRVMELIHESSDRQDRSREWLLEEVNKFATRILDNHGPDGGGIDLTDE